jgi:hypothetical protein
MFRGRAGAEAKLHAVMHELKRAGRGLPFQSVHIHVRHYLWRAPPMAQQALTGGAYLASFDREEQRNKPVRLP